MKTSVPLIASLLAGTLVFTFFVLGERSGERVAQTVSHTGAVREVEPPNVEATAVPAPAPREPAATPSEPAVVDGLARISIPRLRLNVEIGSDLAEGPAWWPVTGRPGGGDTIAVAGHRTTYTRPFYWLERLRPGDPITIRWQGRAHSYRVSGRRVLSAKNLHIADARGHEVLLLSACTPRGSARQRIVVYAWPEANANVADDAPAPPSQKS